MKPPVFLTQEVQNILVTNSSPGIFGFENFGEKKAWLSYSENVAEAIVRNLKLIATGQHKIKTLAGWEIWVDSTPNKNEAKKLFMFECTRYQIKSYELLNRELRNTIRGEIAKDFRNNDGFLYYVSYGVWGVIAIFEKAEEGERYVREFSPAAPPEVPEVSKQLLMEFKPSDPAKQEYRKLFK